MSQAVFDKALEIAASRGEFVTIGGGEPTLHPKIIPWLMQAATALVDVTCDFDAPAVLIITNGKKTEVARKVAMMSKANIIRAELSQDEYHDPIDYSTVELFERIASTRDVTFGGRSAVIDAGRAKENDLNVRQGCPCDTLFITPSGDFYGCGCKHKKLGNVLTDDIPESYWEHHDECHRELAEKELEPA